MASMWSKMSVNLIKITNLNNNLIKPSQIVNPSNQIFVRACKLGFPFLVLANITLSGYVMAKAKQRDEVNAKQGDVTIAKKKNEAIAKMGDGSNAKQRDEANGKQGLTFVTQNYLYPEVLFHSSPMPGTIQVSILEVVGLPCLQQSTSMGVTVSMGKQAYDMEEKGDFSFVLASLRDNLRVMVHDSEGNEIAHTGVESRLIVERGMWDDIFPLQGGGHVRMRLHFILTEDEQKRIRSMRESAARKKREDLLKRSQSSSVLAVASGDSLKASEQARDGILIRAGGQPEYTVPGPGAIVPSQVHPVQKKQVFSTSKSTGALDKLPGYQRVKKELRHQNEEQQSQLDKTPSSVKNMILAFESSPVKVASPTTSKTRATTPVSSITTTNIPLKAPKKTIAVSTKPILCKLQIVPARPISQEKVKEREEVMTDTALKFSNEMVSVTAKPVLSNIETLPAPISKTMGTEKEVIGDYIDSCQETSCSTSEIDTMRMPNKTVSGTAKPVLSDFETLSAPVSKSPMTERKEVEDDVDSRQETSCSTTVINTPMRMPNKTVSVTTKPVLTNSETAPVPMLDETAPEVKIGVRGELVNACPVTLDQDSEQFKELEVRYIEQMSIENLSQPEPSNVVSREEVISQNKLHSRLVGFGQSNFSWKLLSRGVPRRIADRSFMKNKISTSVDSSVFKKNWKSKHLKSCEYNVKSKVSLGNKYHSYGSNRGWIFLEEMIHSCMQSDDRLLIDGLEGGYSNCSPVTTQEKLKDRDDDTDVVPNNDEKTCVELRALVSSERPDSRSQTNPVRQVVNIAIMVGFGILVLLTRQRK